MKPEYFVILNPDCLSKDVFDLMLLDLTTDIPFTSVLILTAGSRWRTWWEVQESREFNCPKNWGVSRGQEESWAATKWSKNTLGSSQQQAPAAGK